MTIFYVEQKKHDHSISRITIKIYQKWLNNSKNDSENNSSEMQISNNYIASGSIVQSIKRRL
jgi:hypothetical protein